MAVIREKLQFQIGKIGVARASESGRITGQAISQGANQLSAMFYKKEAAAAEKAGVKAGASADPQEVITINPETGEPEAYAPPIGMGTIGADAYQRIVMGRFQQSMEDEIKNKGKELAAKYDGNSNGAALYETAMSNYLASMTNVAQDEFKGFIADVGKVYLNSTKTNMSIRQIGRERAAAKKSQENRIAANLSQVEMAVAQYGPKALEGPTTVNALISETSEQANDGGSAGLFSIDELNLLGGATQEAVVKGLLRNAANTIEDPEDLQLIQAAVGTQNANLVPEAYSEIADALRSYGSNYSAMAKLEKWSDGLFSDAVVAANINLAEQVALEEQQVKITIFNMNNALAGKKLAGKALAFTRGPLAVRNLAIKEWTAQINMAGQELANGNEGISKQMTSDAQAVLGSMVEGLYARALSGLTPTETNALEDAVSNRTPMLAPFAARLELNALMRIENATGEPVLKNFGTAISSYRSGAGKNVELIRQTNAEVIAGRMDLSGLAFSADPEKDLLNARAEIAKIPNLNKETAKSMREAAVLHTANNYLQQFMADPNLTRQQLSEGKSVLGSGAIPKGVFSKAQVDILTRARTLAQEGGGLSSFMTQYGTQSGVVTNRIELNEKIVAANLKENEITGGLGDPTNPKDRDVLQDYMVKTFGADVSIIANNPSDPRYPQLMNVVKQASILPTFMVDSFSALARGETRGTNIEAIMANFAEVREYVSPDGQLVQNRALDSLPVEDLLMLNTLSDYRDIVGDLDRQRIVETIKLMNSYNETDSVLKAKTESVLGSSAVDYVAKEIGGGTFTRNIGANLPRSSRLAMKTFVINMVKAGLGERAIGKALSDQIARTYPSGQDMVIGPDGNSYTKGAFSVTVQGYEEAFEEHVIKTIGDHFDLGTFSLGGDYIMGDGGMPSVTGTGSLAATSTDKTVGLVQADHDVYLVPFDYSNGVTSYTVKRRIDRATSYTAIDELVYRKPQAADEFDVNNPLPLIIRTNDPRFLMARSELNLAAQAKVDAGVAKRREIDELMKKGGSGVNRINFENGLDGSRFFGRKQEGNN